jgi:hypothetical protein
MSLSEMVQTKKSGWMDGWMDGTYKFNESAATAAIFSQAKR